MTFWIGLLIRPVVPSDALRLDSKLLWDVRLEWLPVELALLSKDGRRDETMLELRLGVRLSDFLQDIMQDGCTVDAGFWFLVGLSMSLNRLRGKQIKAQPQKALSWPVG